MSNIAIIGAGPAGLSAAVYVKRAGLVPTVYDKFLPGGQIMNTDVVDNYLGLLGVSGPELAAKFSAHAEEYGISPLSYAITSIKPEENMFRVTREDGESELFDAVIAATGTVNRNLGVPGEDKLLGRGVSHCATCDGNFFSGKKVAVIGGGDTAAQDAVYLSRLCEKVYVILRRDVFRAANATVNKLLSTANIEVIYNTNVVSINGDKKVEGLSLSNSETDDKNELEVSGVFIAVGSQPEASYLPDEVERGSDGGIVTGTDCMTNIPGIFAAGDIRSGTLRQLITAAADGAVAASAACMYTNSK